jgi:hypothetical protein
MKNHFHLALETPEPNLVMGMKWLLGTYTSRFNRKYELSGHLFSGRYKALTIDASGDGYLRTACDYVHLNPQRAKLLRTDEPLRAYRWTSYLEYLKPPEKRPAWICVQRLLGELSIPKDSLAGRRQFERRMEARRCEEDPEAWKEMRRGWCLGDDVFRKELLAQMRERVGDNHFGPERRESAEVRAERMVREGLRLAGLKEQDLLVMPKAAAKKLELAVQLRRATTMSLKWIASRLRMGAWTYLNSVLYQHRRSIGQNTKLQK